jgi:hypothetical protein
MNYSIGQKVIAKDHSTPGESWLEGEIYEIIGIPKYRIIFKSGGILDVEESDMNPKELITRVRDGFHGLATTKDRISLAGDEKLWLDARVVEVFATYVRIYQGRETGRILGYIIRENSLFVSEDSSSWGGLYVHSCEVPLEYLVLDEPERTEVIVAAKAAEEVAAKEATRRVKIEELESLETRATVLRRELNLC